MRDVDFTAEAAELWRACFGIRWPTGYRVFLRRRSSRRTWAWINPFTRQIVVYTFGSWSFDNLVRSLLHELAHLHSGDYQHGKAFKHSYSLLLEAAKLKRGSWKCHLPIIKLSL